MDFTKRNPIRANKDFNKIANDESSKLFRQDAEQLFSEMIKEKNLNHSECVIIKEFIAGRIKNPHQEFDYPKTSYYHLASELYYKILISKNDYSIRADIIKRHKLNINEAVAFYVFLASCIELPLTIALIKNS